MAKQSLDQLIAKFEKLAKEEKKAQFAKEVAKQKQKDAIKEASAKPPTKQELTAQRTKELKTKRELQEEKRKTSPQEDILRFGQEQKKFRDLAFKERTVEQEDDEGEKTVSMQYIPRPDGELFQKQVKAYGDSLKLAGLAQKYGTQTPDIRKIDKNRNAITKERNELYKKLMSQEFPLVPGQDGTYTRFSEEEKMKASMEQANNMLVQKYGKAIIPLLSDLRNR
jgi:hypothetical protein